MTSEDYFKFNLYGDNWGDIAEKGKYIFQNHNRKIGVHDSLPFLVFHFVTNYNLSDLELFFRLAGFSAFTEKELPNTIVIPEAINLTNRKNVHTGWFGGYTDEEEAKEFIESKLGEGIISRFKDLKRKQLLDKKVQLLKELRDTEQELENQSFICEVSGQQHKLK